MSELLNVYQAAQFAGCGPTGIRTAVARGLLQIAEKRKGHGKAAGINTFWFKPEDITAYREKHKRPGWLYTSREPKNGQYYKTFLVGGPSRVANFVSRHVADLGHQVLWHREYKTTTHVSVPDAADGVLCLSDMIDHATEKKLYDLCKERGLFFVRIIRKKAQITIKLRQNGLVKEAVRCVSRKEVEDPFAVPLVVEHPGPALVDESSPSSVDETIYDREKEAREKVYPDIGVAAIKTPAVVAVKAPSTRVYQEADKMRHLANLYHAAADLLTQVKKVGCHVLVTPGGIEIDEVD